MSLRPWAPALALGAALAVYLGLSLARLDALPPVGDDEGWIASSALKLATQGVYGSDLLRGYSGSEQHTFHHLPLYPLLQAALFRGFGAGVVAMRAVSIACGAVVLGLVFALGWTLGGGRVAGLAVVLLLGLRLTAAGSGVPLLASARVARYDVAVPAFGLLALWVFVRHGATLRGAAAAGVLVGLSSLCHVYGGFLLPILVVSTARQPNARLARIGGLIAGFALVWLPCAAFAALHWGEFLGQLRRWDGGFDLLSFRAYAENLGHEIERYQPLDASHGVRPGLWTLLLALPIAVVALARSAAPAGRLLAGALLGQAVLFGLLLRVKTFSYVIGLWPLAVVALAWLGVALWDARDFRWSRALLLALLAVIVIEGGLGIRSWLAAPATRYADFEARLAAVIPRDAHVLGLPRFWLGLRDHAYRSWTLPVYLSEARYTPAPLSFDAALDAIGPDVLLIDDDMRRFFDATSQPSHPRHEAFAAVERLKARRGARLAATLSDATYGRVEVYLLPADR